MKGVPACFIAIFMLLVVTACGEGISNPANDQNAIKSADEEAAAIYKKRCLSCHAVDLSGRNGPDLRDVGSRMTEEQLFDIIHDGSKGMPSYKNRLEQEEIEALAQWLANMN